MNLSQFSSAVALADGWYVQDPVWKHTWSPLKDPNFDLNAWKDKHFQSSEDVAKRWTASVMSRYGIPDNVKFACVGYW